MMSENNISAFKIILYGQLIVNIPVVLIMSFVIFLAILIDFGWIPTAFLASGIGWYAWDKLLAKWKFWAINQKVDRSRLYKLGKVGFINFYRHKIFFDKK